MENVLQIEFVKKLINFNYYKVVVILFKLFRLASAWWLPPISLTLNTVFNLTINSLKRNLVQRGTERSLRGVTLCLGTEKID